MSTDGVNNTGADPATASATAGPSAIAVNCLEVGGFAGFQDAVTAKLSNELNVPEPVTLTLFGAGLVGAGFTRRRMKNA